MVEQMKTIKQIANEIGVSKQAVFYRIKQPPLSNALRSLMTKENGILTVNFDGQMLIKQVFNTDTVKTFGDKETPNTAKIPPKENTLFDSKIIQILSENIAVLQEQLKVKDRQIEELTETIKIQAESIKATSHNQLAETIIDRKTKNLSEEKIQKKFSFFNFFKKHND